MDEKVQEKVAQYQQVQEQLEQFRNFLEELNTKAGEVRGIVAALEEIKHTEKGKMMLVPIASGIFLSAELKNTTEVVVNVGSGVCVKKKIEGTKGLLAKRLLEIEKHMEEVSRVIEQLVSVETELEGELSKYV
jgi:prefoldin alpha subunit